MVPQLLASPHNIEELLFRHGLTVSHESIRRSIDRFSADSRHRVKAVRRPPGSMWHLNETPVSLRSVSYVLWRAVDRRGVELDVLLQKQHEKTAAERLFKRVLAVCPNVPKKSFQPAARLPGYDTADL